MFNIPEEYEWLDPLIIEYDRRRGVLLEFSHENEEMFFIPIHNVELVVGDPDALVFKVNQSYRIVVPFRMVSGYHCTKNRILLILKNVLDENREN